MRKLKQFIGREIWMLSESFNIPLGRFAPIIFGWYIGAKGEKRK